MTDFTQKLKELNACKEAVEWVDGRSLRKCWQVADRGDWMLWLAAKVGVDRKLLVLAACDCAETALKHVPEGEDRPRKAIETARAWCDGKATIEDVEAAARAAEAAWAGTWAATEAAEAAEAAAAARATEAAGAARAAATEAAWAAWAAGAAVEEAWAASLKQGARLVRKRIPVEVIEALI